MTCFLSVFVCSGVADKANVGAVDSATDGAGCAGWVRQVMPNELDRFAYPGLWCASNIWLQGSQHHP